VSVRRRLKIVGLIRGLLKRLLIPAVDDRVSLDLSPPGDNRTFIEIPYGL
jgi:hypothetical protein